MYQLLGCFFALVGIGACIAVALALGFGVWGAVAAIPTGVILGWASGVGLINLIGILQDPVGWRLRNKGPLDPVTCTRCGNETKAMSARKFGGMCRQCAEQAGMTPPRKTIRGDSQ